MDETAKLDDPSFADPSFADPGSATNAGLEARATRLIEEGRFARDLLQAMEQVIVGQTLHARAAADRPARRRPRAARRRARPRQDPDRQDAGARPSTREFQRIQFTPDLLPADVIGTADLQPADGRVHAPSRGPIFANLVLADEINRAPAKVQSALLEAMQEHQVTIGDQTLPLPEPVPGARDAEPDRAGGHLPAARSAGRPLHAEAQGRLSRAARRSAQILDRMAGADEPPPRSRSSTPRADPARRARSSTRSTSTTRSSDYIVDLVCATREPGGYGLELGRLIEYGASPRATHLPDAGRQGARVPRGRGYVTPAGREGDRARRAAPPRAHHLRGRGRGA